jgi:hypothetical protein
LYTQLGGNALFDRQKHGRPEFEKGAWCPISGLARKPVELGVSGKIPRLFVSRAF